jgi:hypothetical protein
VSGGEFGRLSEVAVALEVKLGLVARGAKFSFLYTPVIQGPCVVGSFYPKFAFPSVDTEIKVQLKNFPRLTDLTDLKQVTIRLAGNDISCERIESSSYDSTVVSFSTGTRLQSSGQTAIQVYYSIHEVSRAGSFSFEVLPAPTPTISNIYPARGRANVVVNAAATVKYIDPSIVAQAAAWSVSLSGLVTMALAPPSVVVQSTAGCNQRFCAKFVVNFVVPKDALASHSDGGAVTVTIAVGSDSVSFLMPFDDDNTPSVESMDPVSIGIEETASGGEITLYLRNVAQNFCFNPATCSVMFGTRKGTAMDASYANKMLRVSIKPPAIGSAGKVSSSISDNGVTLAFDYEFVAPPASLEPIDGACSGGETLTMKILGWGQVILNAGSVRVAFGDSNEGKVTKIVESVASASYSLTTLQLTSPILSSQGVYNGVVSIGAQKSSFAFECFDSPTAKATPASATLDGRVLASSDGKSINLELRNFPSIATTSDVRVSFGNVVCNGIACSVLRFTNTPDTVIIVLTPPKVKKSSNVFLSVEFQGKAAPPQGGDPSKVYIRSKKIASTPFSHYRPSPVVISARWCRACMEGRTCISGGFCKDKDGQRVRAKFNAFGNSGEGVLTIVAENLPQVNCDRVLGLTPSRFLTIAVISDSRRHIEQQSACSGRCASHLRELLWQRLEGFVFR